MHSRVSMLINGSTLHRRSSHNPGGELQDDHSETISLDAGGARDGVCNTNPSVGGHRRRGPSWPRSRRVRVRNGWLLIHNLRADRRYRVRMVGEWATQSASRHLDRFRQHSFDSSDGLSVGSDHQWLRLCLCHAIIAYARDLHHRVVGLRLRLLGHKPNVDERRSRDYPGECCRRFGLWGSFHKRQMCLATI